MKARLIANPIEVAGPAHAGLAAPLVPSRRQSRPDLTLVAAARQQPGGSGRTARDPPTGRPWGGRGSNRAAEAPRGPQPEPPARTRRERDEDGDDGGPSRLSRGPPPERSATRTDRSYPSRDMDPPSERRWRSAAPAARAEPGGREDRSDGFSSRQRYSPDQQESRQSRRAEDGRDHRASEFRQDRTDRNDSSGRAGRPFDAPRGGPPAGGLGRGDYPGGGRGRRHEDDRGVRRAARVAEKAEVAQRNAQVRGGQCLGMSAAERGAHCPLLSGPC
jgi:hypothetical protein